MGEFWKGLYGMTDAERSIEAAVAALGIPYRTQFPCFMFGMGKYFPDYLFPTIGVVLEVDDDGHNEDEKKAADALRTAALATHGYQVVRCTNEEALNDPHGTVKRLVTPLLGRKGPGLPLCQFKNKSKGKKKKNATGNRYRRSDSAVARSASGLRQGQVR